MLKKNNKKGYAAGASTLVIILAVIIVLYLFIMPAKDRADLLGENISEAETEISDSASYEILLKESPGTMEYIDPNNRDISHLIPNFRLFEITESEIFKEIKTAELKRSWFISKKIDTTFEIPDLENTNNVIVNFLAPERKGNLYLYVNGELLFKEYMKSANLQQPIKIPKDILQQENKLLIELEGVGLRFWDKNEYLLQEIKIIGDYTEKANLESEHIFEIGRIEHNNLELARLRFIPYCKQTEVGVLDVIINDFKIYSAIADCGTPVTLDIPTQRLINGENKISFLSNKGSYLIEQINVRSYLRTVSYPMYYFNIDDALMKKIQDKRNSIWFTMKFVDDFSRKNIEFSINDYSTGFDTKESSYEREITDFIYKGRNFIKIVPKTTIDVLRILVEIR